MWTNWLCPHKTLQKQRVGRTEATGCSLWIPALRECKHWTQVSITLPKSRILNIWSCDESYKPSRCWGGQIQIHKGPSPVWSICQAHRPSVTCPQPHQPHRRTLHPKTYAPSVLCVSEFRQMGHKWGKRLLMLNVTDEKEDSKIARYRTWDFQDQRLFKKVSFKITLTDLYQ